MFPLDRAMEEDEGDRGRTASERQDRGILSRADQTELNLKDAAELTQYATAWVQREVPA